MRLARVEAPASELISTRRYRIEVSNGAVIETAVLQYPDRVVIPLSATPKGGGFVRGAIEVDRETFDRSVQWSREKGLSFVRLAALAERVFGAASNLVTFEERPRLRRVTEGDE